MYRVRYILDPLGFPVPVLLEGKTILQELCFSNSGWDDSIPKNIQPRWLKLRSELEELQGFATP